MTKRTRVSLSILALLSGLSVIPIVDRSQGQNSESATKTQPGKSGDLVYVCACLKTKSCSCMTEAKTEGPCSCGTGGGPPMKAVAKDGAWAKENRDALAK